MGDVRADISVSIDGFITGPNVGPGNGLGDGGERLHDWLVDLESFRELHHERGGQHNRDAEILAEAFDGVGAFVMGRGMFDAGEEPWGPDPPFDMPVFVMTHERREPLEKSATTFIFVEDDPAGVLRRAREVAGDRNVSILGGGIAIQQFLQAGLLDELQIHLIPLVLGSGTPLFDRPGRDVELRIDRVVDSPRVTHVRYRTGTDRG
jgi:dihydrofolate reductase